LTEVARIINLKMKKIKVTKEQESDFLYQSDCAVIVEAFKHFGYEITEDQAREMWERNSDTMCASWLMLPSLGSEEDNYEAIFAECQSFFEEIEDV